MTRIQLTPPILDEHMRLDTESLKLFWDGKEVQTASPISLTRTQNVFAILAAIFTVVSGISSLAYTVKYFSVSARDNSAVPPPISPTNSSVAEIAGTLKSIEKTLQELQQDRIITTMPSPSSEEEIITALKSAAESLQTIAIKLSTKLSTAPSSIRNPSSYQHHHPSRG